MRILEIEPEEVNLEIEYHDTLNPKLWTNEKLKPKVSEVLSKNAEKFIDFLKVDIVVYDWVILGSNAGYNWTSKSDIDLHIMADLANYKKTCPEILEQFRNSKKKVWNTLHEAKIFGHEIELYLQDINEDNKSTGVYSIMYNKWIREPTYDPKDFDKNAVKAKAAYLMTEIDDVLESGCNNPESTRNLKIKISRMRRAGLEEAGEYSVENLAFKTLRNNGYLEKLSKCHISGIDKTLSL